MTEAVTLPREHTYGPHFVSAALTDAHGYLSMAAIETQLIVAATLHADRIGVGYRQMLANGNAWVLSRMSIEMTRMPAIHDVYSITTWIEGFNRHLSNRNFVITNSDGDPMGYARSEWACIDVQSHRPSSLTPVDCFSPRPCPIDPQPRLRLNADPHRVEPYTFRHSDIDFNRHVNSARYVELITDCWPLNFHDSMRISRLDIAYLREARCHQPVEVCICQSTPDPATKAITAIAEIRSTADTICRARIIFTPR